MRCPHCDYDDASPEHEYHCVRWGGLFDRPADMAGVAVGLGIIFVVVLAAFLAIRGAAPIG